MARTGSTASSSPRPTTTFAFIPGSRSSTTPRSPTAGSARSGRAFRTDIDYEKWSGPDKVAGEGKGITVTAKDDPAKGWNQGVTFPHPNTGGRARPGKEYYECLANSPFGNELLLELAKKCVTAEQLGLDDAPDLLVVSFSSNDLIGHTWGPDSQEVLDVTLRSDVLIANLLHFLDDHVGKDQYLFAVTADHGICPLPEVSRSKGIDAKRVDMKALQKALEEHLTTKFGAAMGSPKGKKNSAWVESFADPSTVPWIYFNPRVIAAAHRTKSEVAKAAAEFLSSQPDIARAFTRADLEGPIPPDDDVRVRMRRSYFPDRAGDVCIVLKPYYLPSTTLGTGTTHGAPYDYDAHCAPARLWTRHRRRNARRTRHAAGRGGDLLEVARHPPAQQGRVPGAGVAAEVRSGPIRSLSRTDSMRMNSNWPELARFRPKLASN